MFASTLHSGLLSDFGRVTWRLWVSVSPPVKWVSTHREQELLLNHMVPSRAGAWGEPLWS